MTFYFRPDEPIDSEVLRVAAHEVESTLQLIDTSDDIHSTVHEVRRCCKRIRALLRLVRPGLAGRFEADTRIYADIARRLSRFRDATVVLQTYDVLVADADFGSARDALPALRLRLGEIYADEDASQDDAIRNALKDVREELIAARRQIDRWHLHGDTTNAVCTGAKRTYRRCRNHWRAVQQSTSGTAFHEWRKEVKYHWSQLQLLNRRCAGGLSKRVEQVYELSQDLGELQDLVVFEAALDRLNKAEFAELIVQMRRLVHARRRALRNRTLAFGKRLFKRRPLRFAKLLREGLSAG
jgi:CHAD domain-containing protein